MYKIIFVVLLCIALVSCAPEPTNSELEQQYAEEQEAQETQETEDAEEGFPPTGGRPRLREQG